MLFIRRINFRRKCTNDLEDEENYVSFIFRRRSPSNERKIIDYFSLLSATYELFITKKISYKRLIISNLFK